jgi:ferric enterobactin receptor
MCVLSVYESEEYVAMKTLSSFKYAPMAWAAALAMSSPVWGQGLSSSTESATGESTLAEVEVLGTAEEELRQSLGVSVITADDLVRRPPANDLSEILRTQPGVNLTGASSTGAYGNQRQIDLRGMGPENTMILIDGKPVQSRQASMMRHSGERDSHGDTNWVPADQIERIEVIRGPAAARYGSGAAGGVINIITKRPTDKLSGSVTTYFSTPESSEEGNGTRRMGFNLSGPLSEKLAFRLYGNVAKTYADATDINASEGSTAAGREGTRNKDINGLLSWQLTRDQQLDFEFGYSRQGNIYTGEYLNSQNQLMKDLAAEGSEVRRTYRQTAAVTHKGKWGDFGSSRVIFQYENTRDSNCKKSTAGGPEGQCISPLTFSESEQKAYYLNGELYTPFKLAGLNQVLTTGLEYRHEQLDDANATQQSGPTSSSTATDSSSSASTFAAYLEDNIELTRSLTVTPGLRFDHHSQFGNNLSPSLNANYELSSEFTLKGGIARVFKAPNLYQTNPDYWYTTRGNGCPSGVTGPCYIQGNADLDAETSVNKEIGVAWNNHRGWDASLTYFRNDYKNKIVSDMYSQSVTDNSTYKYFKWYNAGKALIHGLEGNFNIPLLGESGSRLKLINNATWMFQSKSKETGQPLSIIPKYTLNSTLDWRATEKLSAQLTATVYGRQKPRTVNVKGQTVSGDAARELGTYALWGISGNYQISKNYRVGLGISNLLDKQVKRAASQSTSATSTTSGAGALTYNEPGRAYYATFTASF